jgi:hypothetical protein
MNYIIQRFKILVFIALLVIFFCLIENISCNRIKKEKNEFASKKSSLTTSIISLIKATSNVSKKMSYKSFESAEKIYERIRNERELKTKERKQLDETCKLKENKKTEQCKDFKDEESKKKEERKEYEEDGEDEYSMYEESLNKTLKKYSDVIIENAIAQKVEVKEKKKYTYTQSSQTSSCNKDSATGITGSCTGNIFISPYLKPVLNTLGVSKYRDWINQIIEILARGNKFPQICLGDFDPEFFASTPKLQYSACADVSSARR